MIDTFSSELESTDSIAKLASIQPEGAIVLAAVEDGAQVGIGTAEFIHADRASHPGWYITHVYVDGAHQGKGYGYGLVSELLRHVPKAVPVYLVRPAAGGRVFEGGFGFKPVEGEYKLAGFNPSLTLFVAEEPDPDWQR